MPIVRSPFSGGSDGKSIFEEANPYAGKNLLQGKARGVAPTSGMVSSTPSRTTSKAGNLKTSPAQEQNDLDREYRNAIAKIGSSSMSKKQKEYALKSAELSYNFGKKRKPINTPMEMLKSELSSAIEAPTKALGAVMDATAFVSRGLQSYAAEQDDAAVKSFGKVGRFVSASKNPVSALRQIVDILPFNEDPKQVKPVKSSIKEFVSQTKDSKFRAVQTGNKYADAIVDFGLDVLYDPTTYMGVGELNYVGKIGRTELLVKFSTSDMLNKYPQLVGKLDDIARYGVSAIPKEVRSAEGINFGVRFAGKIVPHTEVAAQLVSGKAGIASNVRATVGDVIQKTATGRAVREFATPASRSGLVALGVGRKLDVADSQIVKQVANYTASKTAKSYKAISYAKNLDSIRDVVQDVNKAGKQDYIARLIEDPQLMMLEPDEQIRGWANSIKEWQGGLLGQVNDVYKKFGVDYGANMDSISYIDDYVHHRITDDALKWMFKDKSRNLRRYGLKDTDLTQAEIGAESGAAMYRKIRKPKMLPDGTLEKVEFMGKPVLTGTIDEINKIYSEVTGIPNSKFFATDINSIVNSYAYSMATARGRESYFRRLMDYGTDVIDVINLKSVPDKDLVKNLTGVHKELMDARRALATAVNGGVRESVKTAKQAAAFAGKVLNKKGEELATIESKVALIRKQIAKTERDLSSAYVLAASKGEAARGTFLDIHKVLIEDVQKLKAAIDSGNISEAVANDTLKAIYLQMNPEAKRIPSASKMLDNINRKMGVSDSAQVKELEKRMVSLQKQLASEPPVDPQELNDLIDLEQQLSDHMAGFTVLGDVKFKADYTEDGLLYGVMDDVVERPFDPNREPSLRVLSTRPVTGGVNLTTDEMAAAREAFLSAPDSVAVHALEPDEILDMRKPEVFKEFWDPQGGVGEAVDFALRQAGLDEEGVFKKVWDEVIDGEPLDPMFEQVYPELADLVSMVGATHNQVFKTSIVDDSINVDSFDVLKQIFNDVAASGNLENSDMVAEQMLDNFMRAMVEEGLGNTGKPVLFPSAVVYGADNEMADEAYSLLIPDRFTYASRYGKKNITPDMMEGATAPVHFTSGDDFIRSITDGDYHTASFENIEMQSIVSETGKELQDQLIAREAVRADVKRTGGQLGGLKSQGSRRMKAAEKAYAEYVDSGLVEVFENGKKVKVTREKAISILNKKEDKLNNNIARLNDNIARMVGGETKSLMTRKAEQEARLSTLLDSRRVIERWNERTGDALRAEIDNLNTAIATDVPAGQAGTNSRAWARRVNERIDNVSKLEGSSAKTAWERVSTQLGADEAQLAYLDTIAIPESIMNKAAAAQGLVGAKMRDDVKAGWEAIRATGLQVPEDMMAVMMPNIDKLANRASWQWWQRAYMEYHQAFKTYATMSPGFLVRNAMSATFMNSAAGVSGENMIEGLRAAQALRKHGIEGWLGPKGLNITDPEQIKFWETALRASEATGRGVADDFVSPTINGGNASKILDKIQKNKATEWFARGNDFVERAVRLPMAVDTLKQGKSFDEAVYRITRYHFDYTDLSKLDEKAKAFIPFWIWTTRNLPLQWTEQLLRPSTYSIYERLKERNPVTIDVAQPAWLSETGPMGLFGDWVLNPDVPMSRMGSSAKSLVTLSGLAGQLNPAIKAIPEWAAGKSFGTNVPFPKTGEKASGVDIGLAGLGSLLGVEGLGGRNAAGELVANPKASALLANLLPPLAKAERLTGGKLGGKSSYDERWISSILTELGIPARKVGPRQQRGEIINRQFQLSDLMKQLESKGMVKKNER